MGTEPSALERLRALEEKKLAAIAGPTAPTTSSRRGGTIGAVLTGLGLLAWKGKALLLFALTKAKFLFLGLQLGKYLVTGWTMILMIFVYSRFYGLAFAGGLVLLILIHELGHGFAAQRLGMKVGAPVFIPFVGAFISLKEKPRSTFEDFVIGAGGPLAGSLGGALCLVAATAANPYWAGLLTAVGYFTLMMNLFNLTPVWSLDGARMLGAVRSAHAVWGVGFLLVVFFGTSAASGQLNPVGLILVIVAAAREGRAFWRARSAKARSALERLETLTEEKLRPDDEAVTPRQRAIATATYFSLAAALISALHLLHRLLPVVGT